MLVSLFCETTVGKALVWCRDSEGRKPPDVVSCFRALASQLADQVLRFLSVIDRVSGFPSCLHCLFSATVLIPVFVFIAVVLCDNRLIKLPGRFYYRPLSPLALLCCLPSLKPFHDILQTSLS